MWGLPVTKIGWVINPDNTPGSVLNVISGCTDELPCFMRCFAKRMAYRLKGRYGYPADDPFQVTLHPDKIQIPFHTEKPTTYFLCSMGDLFHHDVPTRYLIDVFKMMIENPNDVFLVLTKRPERLVDIIGSSDLTESYLLKIMLLYPHINLGFSAENQELFDKRANEFELLPTINSFLSLEPLHGPITIPSELLKRLSVVIVGGENGPGARPMHPDWVRSIRDQCNAVGVMFYFKGWGEWVPVSHLKNIMALGWTNKKRKTISGCTFFQVGSKASGHRLDGNTYHQLPWFG